MRRLTTAIPFRPMVDLRAERREVIPSRVAGDMVGGLLLGSLIGAGVGALAAYADTHISTCRTECGPAWLAVPALGIVGGGTGIVVGSIVGLTVHRDSYWISVSLPVSIR